MTTQHQATSQRQAETQRQAQSGSRTTSLPVPPRAGRAPGCRDLAPAGAGGPSGAGGPGAA